MIITEINSSQLNQIKFRNGAFLSSPIVGYRSIPFLFKNMSKVKRICQKCKTEFKVFYHRIKDGRGKFCSRECYNIGRRCNKIKKICLICSKKIEIYPSAKQNKGKFCSKKCYGIWQSKNILGKNHAQWKGGKVKKTCIVCGKSFKLFPNIARKGKFCSRKCMGKWYSENKSGENSYNWKGGLTQERRNNKYKLWRKKVFERDSYTCLICGKVGGHLNAHHIKNWVSHTELRYVIDNGMTMCQDCHNLVDKELPLFTVKLRRPK